MEATGDREKDKQESINTMKKLIKDSIRELNLSQELVAPTTSGRSTETPIQQAVSGSSSEDDRDTAEENSSAFDFGLIDPFVVAVKDAIEWEETPEPPAKSRKYFPHLKKKPPTFPLMEEIRDLVTDEWRKVDRRPIAFNRFNKLYPLAESDAQLFDSMPSVDASIMRLARNTTLPLEDAVSFRDVLDRKIDSDLKKAYQAAGGACKPAVALTSVSRAARAWTDNIEVALRRGLDTDQIVKALDELKLASDFIAEAAIDTLKCSARAMLYSVTARRALWLKPWSADPSSKQTWCRIPYDGKALFGEKLDTAINRVTGGKSGLIPQDRNKRKKFAARAAFQQKARDARTYRPGREYRRGWKGSQATFLKMGKQKATTSAHENQKSF